MYLDKILNIYKPPNMTSYDVIRRLKHKLPRKTKIGHGGTLDPMAEGVLPIAVGKATKRLQDLPKEKEYVAEILLGVSTTTDDKEGEVIEIHDCESLLKKNIENELKKFEGKIQQRVPLYSAVHYQGERLYKLARMGKAPDFEALPVKEVEVYKITIEDINLVDLEKLQKEFPKRELESHYNIKCRIHCSSGTYIRSIARDIGIKLGVGGCLYSLVRTLSGGMRIEESKKVEEIEL